MTDKKEGNVGTVLSDVLKNRTRLFETIRQDNFMLAALQLLLFAAVFLAAYGFVMVMHIDVEHALLVSLKIPAIFGATLLLTMPTLYVFSAIQGSELNLRQMLTSALAGMALTAIVMFALVPIIWLFAFSNASEGFLKFLNFFFIVGPMISGFIVTNRCFRHINHAMNPKEKKFKGAGVFVLWAILFLLVFAQMTANFGPLFEKNDNFLRKDRQSFLQIFFGG